MKKRKILIIEDDISIKDNITDLLEIHDFKVFSAINGHDGLELASEISPDLILCDVMMPKMDGFEVKSIISEDDKLSMIPFIFLTAKTDLTSFRKGMNLGAEDYITKPFENVELINAVNLRLKKFDEIMKKVKNKVSTDDGDKKPSTKLLVTVGTSQKFIDYSTIVYIKSFGNYSQIFTDSKEKITVRKLLKEWEELLPVNDFFRIHQSFIINLNYVKKIEPYTKYSYLAKMNLFDVNLPISARYSQKLKSRFQF